MSRVTYPVLAQMKDNSEIIKVVYKKMIRSTMLITFAVILGLAAVAKLMIKKVLVTTNHLSFLKYVGLDIVITENGFKIIEMNSFTPLSAVQMEEGLLKDDRLKRFFLG